MQKFGFVLLTLIVGLTSACSSVTLRDKSSSRLSEEPTFEKSNHYYLWGLVGENHINAKELCNGKKVLQVQAQDTFLDGFLTVITLGIYRPRSIKLWCDRSEGGKS